VSAMQHEDRVPGPTDHSDLATDDLRDDQQSEGHGSRSGADTVLAGSPVVVRRNAGLAAVIGAAASAIAIAYLWRAIDTGAVLDWALCVVLALIAGFYLAGLLDARTPLLVADDLGVRIRLGNQWRGLPWDAVGKVAVQPRRGLLRDGRLLFASADRRSLIDERGRRVLTMAGHLPEIPDIRQIGDGLFAVNTELYRDGRRIAAFGTEGVSILGASSDGSVALLQRDGTGELVVYRDGVPHALSNELTGSFPSGVVAPDGGRILLQRDRGAAIVIDAATRRPLARLEIVSGDFVFDWRTA